MTDVDLPAECCSAADCCSVALSLGKTPAELCTAEQLSAQLLLIMISCRCFQLTDADLPAECCSVADCCSVALSLGQDPGAGVETGPAVVVAVLVVDSGVVDQELLEDGAASWCCHRQRQSCCMPPFIGNIGLKTNSGTIDAIEDEQLEAIV